MGNMLPPNKTNNIVIRVVYASTIAHVVEIIYG